MPVTFIHGVNVRTGLAYEKGVAARDELLRRLVLRPLGEAKSAAWVEMDIHSPYWGGTRFRLPGISRACHKWEWQRRWGQKPRTHLTQT